MNALSRHGLSCYTANLTHYLAADRDADRMLACSVRLAVRCDLADGLLAFSHHDVPLDVLPDGTRLRYAGAASPDALVAGLTDELDRYGRALVVVDGARLAWSPARGTGRSAPHWLLVEGRCGDRWDVVDEFSGLLPEGQQDAHAGPLSTPELLAVTAPSCRTPDQALRDDLAFGFPVPVPDAGDRWWLRREPASDEAAPLPGRWLAGDAAALPFLAEYVAERGAGARRHLDDVWAAAGHRAFAYHWRLARTALTGAERDRLAAALAAWEGLLRTLRFAVESARRGRARPALVHKAVADVLLKESP